MKKLMFAAAVAVAGLAFGIESANTVGYTKLDFMEKATFYMMGTQFDTAQGTTLKLSDLNFGDLSAAPYYSEFIDEDGMIIAPAPEVRIANANSEGFKTYYYLQDGKPTEVEGVYEPAWVNTDLEFADPDVVTGIGFWFYNPSSNNPELTTAGGVPDDALIEKTFDDTFRVLVNPYPKAVALSEITFGGIASVAPAYSEFIDEDGQIVGTAPEIRVPNESTEGFKTYYYLSDGKPTETEGVYEPGWVNTDLEYADPVIPVGRGCWFKCAKPSMTVTFTK